MINPDGTPSFAAEGLSHVLRLRPCRVSRARQQMNQARGVQNLATVRSGLPSHWSYVLSKVAIYSL
jgi:hypothetical protein